MNAKLNKNQDSKLLISHLKYVPNKNLQQYNFFKMCFSKVTGNAHIFSKYQRILSLLAYFLCLDISYCRV